MDTKDMQFVGSIPENYDRYLGPLLFNFTSNDTADRLISNVPENGKVLEIAAGTGITTEHMRSVLPESVHILATDVAEPMLEHAKEKRGDLKNVTWEVADAMNLPYGDNEFDAVVCQFGIMFFPDKEKGLSEMYRVLKPGGTIIVNVWDSLEENKVIQAAAETIATFFESDPPQFLRIPFGFYDIGKITEMFTSAGFTAIEADVVSETFTHIPAADIARGTVTGNPTIGEIEKRASADSEVVIEAVTKEIESRFGKDTPSVTMQEIVFVAQK